MDSIQADQAAIKAELAEESGDYQVACGTAVRNARLLIEQTGGVADARAIRGLLFSAGHRPTSEENGHCRRLLDRARLCGSPAADELFDYFVHRYPRSRYRVAVESAVMAMIESLRPEPAPPRPPVPFWRRHWHRAAAACGYLSLFLLCAAAAMVLLGCSATCLAAHLPMAIGAAIFAVLSWELAGEGAP